MARLNADNQILAKEMIGRYPRPKSALIPLLHLVQEQDGYVTDDGLEHVAELVGVTAAEALGTCSFYEMLKREPVGEYHVNICHGISCHLLGADDLIHHAEATLGVREGSTTEDGKFTIEGVECIAACTEAPCLQINYRYFNKVTTDQLDSTLDELRKGRIQDIPSHGTLALTRQHIPEGKAAGPSVPGVAVDPEWMKRNPPPEEDKS